MTQEQTIRAPKLAPTNEILSAFLSNMIKDDVQKLKSNTQGFIREKFNLDLSNHEVTIVENDSHTMHLTLPYYSIVEEIRSYYEQMKRQAREDFLKEIGLSPEVKSADKKNNNEKNNNGQVAAEKNMTLTIGGDEESQNHH